MNPDWTLFRLISASLTAGSCFFLAIFSYSKNPDKRINRIFSLSNTLLGLWNISDLSVAFSSTVTSALLFDRFSYLWGTLVIPSTFYLCREASGYEKTLKYFYPFQWSMVALFLATLFTPWLIKGVEIQPFKEIPGPLYLLFILFFLTSIGYGIFHLYRGFQSAQGLHRTQLGYMFLALIFGFSAGGLYFITMLDPIFPPIFYIVELGYVWLVAYAILRYRLIGINLALRRATLMAFYVMIIFVPLVLGAWAFRRNFEVQIVFLFLATLVAPLVFNGLRDKLLEAVDQLRPFKGKYKNNQEIEALRRHIASALTTPEWAKNVSLALSELIETDTVGVFLYEAGFYRPVSFLGGDRESVALNSPLEGSPLIKHLIHAQTLVYAEEIINQMPTNEAAPIIEEMGAMGAKLCAPLFDGERLSGFITLGRKLTQGKKSFTESDFNFDQLRFAIEFSTKMEKNQVVLNRMIIEKLGGDLDKLPGMPDKEIIRAINDIVASPFPYKNLDLIGLPLTAEPGRCLRKISSKTQNVFLSHSESLLLNVAIIRSLYSEAFNATESEELYNEEDIKAIWRIAQDAEHMLLVIESNSHQRERIAEWAHDLRHPFTKGSFLALEPMIRGELGPLESVQRTALTSVMEDMRFVERYLQMAVNPEAKPMDRRPVPLAHLFEYVDNRYRFAAEKAAIKYNVSKPEKDLMIFGDFEMLAYRVFNNLLDNALNHTPMGGEISVGYIIDGKNVVGHVENRGGPPIPETLLPRIFERGENRGKLSTAGGAGLGLYNVAQTVQENGGRTWVESTKERGTIFHFTLLMDGKARGKYE